MRFLLLVGVLWLGLGGGLYADMRWKRGQNNYACLLVGDRLVHLGGSVLSASVSLPPGYPSLDLPAFSPDGRYFFAYHSGRKTFFIEEIASGQQRELDLLAPDRVFDRDFPHYLVLDDYGGHLQFIPWAGGESFSHPWAAEIVADAWPLSPDGEWLAFFEGQKLVFLQPHLDQKISRFLPYAITRRLSWLPGGQGLTFYYNDTEGSKMLRLSPPDWQAEEIFQHPKPVSIFMEASPWAVSSDGPWVYYFESSANRDEAVTLYRYDWQSRQHQALSPSGDFSQYAPGRYIITSLRGASRLNHELDLYRWEYTLDFWDLPEGEHRPLRLSLSAPLVSLQSVAYAGQAGEGVMLTLYFGQQARYLWLDSAGQVLWDTAYEADLKFTYNGPDLFRLSREPGGDWEAAFYWADTGQFYPLPGYDGEEALGYRFLTQAFPAHQGLLVALGPYEGFSKPGALFWVDLPSGQVRLLRALEDAFWDTFSPSPDGGRAAWITVYEESTTAKVWVYELESGRARLVAELPDYQLDGFSTQSPSGLWTRCRPDRLP
jgi:hypothetical protein